MHRYLLSVGFALLSATSAWAKLEITDVQARYGPHGPARKSLEFVPGDQVFVGFRAQGVQKDADGKVDLTMSLLVRDTTGKVLFQNKNSSRQVLGLGGESVTGFTHVNLGLQTAPGDYVLKFTLVDNIANAEASFERKISCKPLELSIAQLAFFLDKEGKLPGSSSGIVGQAVHFRFVATGFDRTKPKVMLTMLVQTLDKNDQELLPKPLRVEVNLDDAKAIATAPILFNGSLGLNRVGEFRLRITLIDEIGERKTDVTVPLKVHAP